MTKAKLQELKLILETTKLDILDILGITETKLGKERDEEIEIEGYKLYRRDRDRNSGGGIVMYYKENLNMTELKLQIDTKIVVETIWADVQMHSQKMAVAVVYRPPDQLNFYSEFAKQVEKIRDKRTNLLIMGDLNSDMLKHNEGFGKQLKLLIHSHDLKNIIKEPTRITGDTRTLIDVILINDKEKIINAGVLDTGISDNRLVYSLLKFKNPRPPAKFKEVIDWKKFDEVKFRTDVRQAPWHCCNIFEEVDDNLWMTEQLYSEIAKENVPKRTVRIRSKTLPWMNSCIRKLMNQRYKQLLKFNRTQDQHDRDEYKKLRNKVSRELKTAEANYWKRKLEEISQGSSDFWKTIRTVTKTERSKKKRIGPIKNESVILVYDEKMKTETMNEFFATVGENLASNLMPVTKTPVEYIYRVTPTINELRITNELFSEKMSKLNPKKASGPDGITTKELKIASQELSYSIANICRIGYMQGEYPSSWKEGKVKSAFKSGEPSERGNYRPLTMLSVPSKVSEAVICDQLDNQVEKTRQKNQWAHRKGTSTESVLLYLSDKWKAHVTEGEVVGVLFVDFSKAFDSVDHDILKQKMIAAGITGGLYNLIDAT